jgi:hypothetical protein
LNADAWIKCLYLAYPQLLKQQFLFARLAMHGVPFERHFTAPETNRKSNLLDPDSPVIQPARENAE